MAYSVLNDIVANIISLTVGLHKVYVCHRMGKVDLGQESIIIAISSPHRLSGHLMVMEILNEIKKRVPIWKKICFESQNEPIGNDSHWSNNSEGFWLEKK